MCVAHVGLVCIKISGKQWRVEGKVRWQSCNINNIREKFTFDYGTLFFHSHSMGCHGSV